MLQLQLQPFPVLHTSRCRLRSIVLKDVPELYHIRSNDDVLQYLDREKAAAIKEIEMMIRKIQEDAATNQAITWAVTFHNSDTLIGYIGYWRVMKEHYRAEIGYILHPDYWRQGIMSEVMREVLRFGFQQMKLHSIEANVNPDNTASIQLLLKHHFQQEGYFKENYYFKGRFYDSVIYSLLSNAKIE